MTVLVVKNMENYIKGVIIDHDSPPSHVVNSWIDFG